MSKYLPWAAITAIILTLGGMWLHDRDQRMQAEGRNQILTGQLDSLSAIARQESAQALQLADSVERLRTYLDSVQVASDTRIERLEDARPEIVEQIVVAEDTAATRAAVDRLVENHQAETRELRRQIAGAAAVIEAQAGTIEALTAANTELEEALSAAESVIENHPGDPSFWSRAKDVGIGILIGGLVTVAGAGL